MQSVEEVVADWLTKAEAKSAYRHLNRKYQRVPIVTIQLEVMTEDGWSDVSYLWAMDEVGYQEEWFYDKRLDYNWWLEFGEVRKCTNG